MLLSEHINQSGITTGPRKLEIFRKAMELRKVPGMLSQDGAGDEAVAYVKLFNPTGVGTWFITEWDPETNMAFGLCHLFEYELGDVSLVELSETPGPLGIGIEVDVWFEPTPLGELRGS